MIHLSGLDKIILPPKRIASLHKKAANLGNTEAQRELAQLHSQQSFTGCATIG
jgi:hypothetical protein